MTAGQREARKEHRVTIQSILFPFLGSRAADFQPFQYILEDVSPGGVRISIPSWVVSREHLSKDDIIHFHVPFMLEERLLNVGRVAWANWDEDEQAQYVGAALEYAVPVEYPVHISHSTSTVETDLTYFNTTEDLLQQVLNDTVMVKKGIIIYLRHLSAFFKRATDLSKEEYEYFREVVLEDARVRAEKNAANLRAMAEAELTHLDLEELRKSTEPEIYIDLFRQVLGEETVRMYLDAIKLLEKKLYANHNTAIMLYLQSFGV